jgi:hypothetical protein
MTRRLRQRHHRMFLALAILVPVIFILGLLARRPVPVMPVGINFTPLTTR